MNPAVCFTGPAKIDTAGSAPFMNGIVPREVLVRASTRAGLHVYSTYNPACAFLVASRKDTVKARKALKAGKLVLTYDEFIRHLKNLGVNVFNDKLWEGVGLNPIVDHDPDPDGSFNKHS